MLPFQALLPRSSASRRMPWDRGGRARGRSPPADATAWHGRCPSTPCANHRSRGFYTDLQGPAGGSDWHSFEHQSFHPPDRCAPAFLTRSDFSPLDARAPNSLSWGCQIPPLRRLQSRSQLGCVRTLPRSRLRAGVATPDHVPPSWFLTTSTVCSSSTASGCCTRIRPWGSPRFHLLRNRLPRDAFLPFRALLPDGSGDPRPKPRTAGDRHRGPDVAAAPPFTGRLAPSSLCRPHACACCRSRPRGLAPPPEP